MKFLSELTGKVFDTAEECEQAEKEFEEQQSIKKIEEEEKERVLMEATDALKKANENYQIAREKAAEILEKSNEEVSKILSEASELVEKNLRDIKEAQKTVNKKEENTKNIVWATFPRLSDLFDFFDNIM